MEYNRQEGELFTTYVRRITDALIDKKLDYQQWGDLLIGEKDKYASDNFRKGSYIMKIILPLFEADLLTLSGDYNDDLLELLEKTKDELYKERVKLQDVVREKRAYLRQESRFENLVEVLKDALYNKPQLETETKVHRGKPTTEGVLLISDIHYGIKVDNVLSYYDTEEAKEKMELLLAKTIERCNADNIDLLHICLGGDLINGLIQVTGRIEAEEDVITSITNLGELLSQFIAKIKSVVPIKVYGVGGNHSRLVADKKQSLKSENYERLIFHYIKIRTGITVLQNGYEDWCEFKVGDKLAILSHGDKDSLATAKKNYVNVTRKVPNMIFLGHIHHMNIKDDNGTDIYTNGAWLLDDYALSMRFATECYQLLVVFKDEDKAIHKLSLKLK